MRALRKFGGLLAACIAAAAAFAQPAAASDLSSDPLIRDTLNRANFEPGGKYHLFGSRGTVAERTGQMSITPTVTQQIGNLQIRQASISGNPGYVVRFSGHGHQVHAPFDNHASRSASAKEGSVLDGFTMYQMNWSGYEHHPADGYDGPQGGGYPAPHGARDIYTYEVKGKAQSIKLNLTDTRSTEQRFADRFNNAGRMMTQGMGESWRKMTETNPDRNRFGNAAEAINGAFGMAGNLTGAFGQVIGVGDAIDGIGFSIDLGTMAAISPMSAETAMSTVSGLSSLGRFENHASATIRDWAAANPNAAEGVQAAANIATAATAAKAATGSKAGKAGVSGDFSDANRSYSQHTPIRNYTHTEYNGKSAITDGRYVTDPIGMDRHKPITAPSGKSVFKSDVDAERATLDAARYADKHNLWNENGKAKVPTQGIIGYTNGQPTQIINIYRGKPNRNGISPIHGSPGKE